MMSQLHRPCRYVYVLSSFLARDERYHFLTVAVKSQHHLLHLSLTSLPHRISVLRSATYSFIKRKEIAIHTNLG